jgi:nitrate reductase gamma subunit
MNEETDTSVPAQSRLKRVGRILFISGIVIVVGGIVLGLSVVLVAAFTGSFVIVSNYGGYAILALLFGVLLVIIGLIALILPGGFSKDAVWAMRIGPFR